MEKNIETEKNIWKEQVRKDKICTFLKGILIECYVNVILNKKVRVYPKQALTVRG